MSGNDKASDPAKIVTSDMLSTTLPRSESNSGIAYHRSGEGPPIVLLHGVGLRGESWLKQWPALNPTHTVYVIDLPGHGYSPQLSLDEPQIADFTTAVDTWVQEIVEAPVLIVGHSLGALIAIDYAARFAQRCAGIAALTAVFDRPRSSQAAVLARAEAMPTSSDDEITRNPLTRWFGEAPTGADAVMADLCRKWLLQGDRTGYATAYRMFARQNGPSRSTLASIAVPALFLAADGDPNSTPAMSRAMAELAPLGDVVVIKHSRHMVQMTHGDEVNQALLSWIQICDASVRQAPGS